MVFLEKPEQLIKSSPSLTKIARIPAEVGRIEFKAFDSCDDFSIYAGLLALLKGLLLDRSLEGRATVPDTEMHQLSAQQGFDSPEILAIAQQVLQAVKVALENDPDINLLAPLRILLDRRETPGHKLIKIFNQVGSVEEVLKKTYGG
jgi:hypothetical protein